MTPVPLSENSFSGRALRASFSHGGSGNRAVPTLCPIANELLQSLHVESSFQEACSPERPVIFESASREGMSSLMTIGKSFYRKPEFLLCKNARRGLDPASL